MVTRLQRDLLFVFVQSYFDEYLRRTRGASPHTIRAYGDGLRLFFVFLAGHLHKSVGQLRLEDIRAEAVLAFLNDIESSRKNRAVSRNNRLAAIKGFVQHLLRNDVTRADQYSRILAIPTKRTTHRPVSYLEPEEARAVVSAVDSSSKKGIRDRDLLLFLYNTGARVSEALSVRGRDLRLERPSQVRLFGKAGKERICPIWPETSAALRELIRLNKSSFDEVIFRNARGEPLSRDGVAYVLEKYVRKASDSVPSLRGRNVTPHILRHSCAVALLQAGVDVTVIRDYLGHSTIATTNHYITSNLQMKRDVLEAFWKRAGLDSGPRTKWRASPKLLEFLSSL
jgi:site-specific recombinase XerD